MAEDENAKVESETAASHATARGTEWTASDARGPLNAVGDPISAQDSGSTLEPAASAENISASDAHPDTAADPLKTHDAGGGMAAQPARRSLWPVAAGIVVGAIIGAGSAAAYYATQGGDAAQVAALSSRIDALQNRPDPSADIAALKSRSDSRADLTALKGTVADLDGKVAALQKKDAAAQTAAVQPAPKSEAAKPDFDPGPLQQKVTALQSSIDAVRAEGTDVKAVDAKVAALAATVAALNGVDGKVATLQSGFENVQKQAVSAQANIDTLQSGQKALEGKVTSSPALAVVADSLIAQITRGEPYVSQVEALAAIGADPAAVAVLKENADKGVPSAKLLAAKFEPYVDPIIASEQRGAPNSGFLDKLKSGMFSMVSVRRSDETTGDTLAAHVALIQADLAHDDVAGAYGVWGALPAGAKAKSDAWGALAKTHAEAMQAAHALQTRAIAALGAKKS